LIRLRIMVTPARHVLLDVDLHSLLMIEAMRGRAREIPAPGPATVELIDDATGELICDRDFEIPVPELDPDDA
jgi:hypothetical protein